MPPPPIRTEIVEPPSARREALAVVRAAAMIAFAAWCAIGARRGGEDGAAAAAPADLMPFQVLFRDVDGPAQRVFRSVQEGFAEIEIRRSAAKSWPEPAALAAEGIPPFAPDPQDRGAYAWTLRRRSGVVNYLGTPAAGSGRAPWLLLVEEPEPDSPDASHLRMIALDEEHRRLGDGTILHVSIWTAPVGAAPGGDVLFRALLIKQGWKQIRVGNVPSLGR